ncbi:hypothetical protein IX51_01270 [uncultured archaeon]|nr:hypothetical protein IX51_01270 [uncultured archaeon]
MYSAAFVKLVEEEYMNVLRESNSLKNQYGFTKGHFPEYICSGVQKFRNWLTMALRTADIIIDDVSVSPEDVLVHAAISRSFAQPYELRHPKLISALSLFSKDDFEAIFGVARKSMFERGTDVDVSVCQFRVCFEHCELVMREIGRKKSFWRPSNADAEYVNDA